MNSNDNLENEPKVNPLYLEFNKLAESNIPILDLTIANPTQAGFNYPEELIGQAFQIKNIHEYNPNPRGSLETRNQIANYYLNRQKKVNPENLFLVSGSSEAFSYILKLLCDPGDNILLPMYSYPLYEYICGFENVEFKKYFISHSESYVSVSKRKLSFELEIGEIEENINDRTRAIVIVQPNNPTGSILSWGIAQRLVELANQYMIPIIVDEVFADYCIKDNYRFVVSKNVPVFTLNGLSKTLGLPGFKLGWIHIDGNKELVQKLSNQLEFILDAYLTVNTPVQLASEKLFEIKDIIQSQIKSRIQHNLNSMDDVFKESNLVNYYIPDGGWYAVVAINTRESDEDFCVNLLKHHHVFTHPGYMFDYNSCHVILSLITPEETFKNGLIKILSNIKFGNLPNFSNWDINIDPEEGFSPFS